MPKVNKNGDTVYESVIRWNSESSRRLEDAINHFNRERAKVENKEILPPVAKYDNFRDRIITRRELESTIKALNSASVENLSAVEKLASGESVSKWEYDDTIRRKNLAGTNLLNELDAINRKRAEGLPTMGEERISEIQTTLKMLDDSLESLEDFKKAKKPLKIYGREDLDLRKAQIFMENFKYSANYIQNFDNYNKLKEKMNDIKNPLKFYDAFKKSNILMDIFLWYKEPDGLMNYGNFNDDEEAFNYALREELEIDIPE